MRLPSEASFSTNRTNRGEFQITKSRDGLTELEGAILGVLRRSRGLSAYAVRQVFLVSLSAEWSGSAGAVYPAIARMKTARLIAGRAQKDARGTVTYALTAAGIAAHDAWLCDVERAAGPGSDPFRTRAALWRELALAKRRALMKALRAEIERRRDALTAKTADDSGDAITDELLLAQLELRLRWLGAQ
jgi:DNA-binding PadR family transcriptional regulator